jgi:hypothetical protein
MAQRVEIILIDDIDGSSAVETITFGLDGVSYEIDLSEEHAKKLRDDFAQWTGHARRAPGGRRTTTRRTAARRSNVSEIREWARANGYQVTDRGRISTEIQEAYAKAN